MYMYRVLTKIQTCKKLTIRQHNIVKSSTITITTQLPTFTEWEITTDQGVVVIVFVWEGNRRAVFGLVARNRLWCKNLRCWWLMTGTIILPMQRNAQTTLYRSFVDLLRL